VNKRTRYPPQGSSNLKVIAGYAVTHQDTHTADWMLYLDHWQPAAIAHVVRIESYRSNEFVAFPWSIDIAVGDSGNAKNPVLQPPADQATQNSVKRIYPQHVVLSQTTDKNAIRRLLLTCLLLSPGWTLWVYIGLVTLFFVNNIIISPMLFLV